MHTPVLLKEVVETLSPVDGDVYLDATLGAGGHAEAVWQAVRKAGGKVGILGIDLDESAVEVAKARLEIAGAEPQFQTLNFRNLDRLAEIVGKAPDKILFDLGWNKEQFETPEGEAGRGFSFQKDEPLVMTFAKSSTGSVFTAYDVVNGWDEENLKTIIEAYGEERFAGRIAKAIVERRKEKPIKTSSELAEIVKEAIPMFRRFGRIHPATKTFQAIRIAVNDELQALREGLAKAWQILGRNGVLCVISFHSLEDRIVKRFFREMSDTGEAELLTKKPIVPSEEETRENPRARSAKLRAIKKIVDSRQ